MSRTRTHHLRTVQRDPRFHGFSQEASRSAAVPLTVISLLLLPLALMGPSIGLGLYAWLVLLIGVAALWRPGEPPILLLVFGYQWLQASIAVYYNNWNGLPADAMAEWRGQHERAIFLMLTGLAVLAVAIRSVIGRPRRDLADRLHTLINAYSSKLWFMVFAAAWLISQVCLALAGLSEGLRQPLLFVGQIQWAAFLVLTVATFGNRNSSKALWFVAFALELAMSLGGYFSSFSDVFFYSLIGIGATQQGFRPRTIVLLTALGSVMLVFAVVWTGIKRDYRDYVSQGVKEQVVSVGYLDRLTKIRELVGEMDAPAMRESADLLIQRMSYFEFFGLVLDRVPEGSPYTGGKIWGNALTNPFLPRLLFPDKPQIDDTDLTEQYTGIHVAAWASGVSVSLGYMAEAYIDFGPVLMFAAIALLGVLMGALYRWLLNQPGRSLIIGAALAPAALMPAHPLEASSLKLLAPLVLAFIGSWVLLYMLGPRFFRFLDAIRDADPASKPRL